MSLLNYEMIGPELGIGSINGAAHLAFSSTPVSVVEPPILLPQAQLLKASS
jgi:hypothetical protein